MNVFARARQSCEKCPTNPHRLTQPPPTHVQFIYAADFEGGAGASAEQRKVQIKRFDIDRTSSNTWIRRRLITRRWGRVMGRDGWGAGPWKVFGRPTIGASAKPPLSRLFHPYFTSRVRHASFSPPPSVASASCHRNIKTQKKSSSCFPLQVFFILGELSVVCCGHSLDGNRIRELKKKKSVRV